MQYRMMAERKNIPADTKLRLFSAAAGHCQNPDCLQALYPAEMGGDKHIAEMAHLIPHGRTGPRHQERLDENFDPNTFDNLILLCPTCHTIIDLTYLSFEPRDTALKNIRTALASIKALIEGAFPDVNVGESGGGESHRLMVRTPECQIKIELSPVPRGTVNPLVWMEVHERVEETFPDDSEAIGGRHNEIYGYSQ